MNDPLRQLDQMVSVLVANDQNRTGESIRERIDQTRAIPIFEDVSDEQCEQLARELEERIGISMGFGAVVTSKDFKPWLEDAKANELFEPYYWDRYKKLLQDKRLPGDVITSTDEVTDRILGRMGNPRDEKAWDRKGMVVGHVQSGKTANYTGLVCKAADAGYRLIVVIAGIHNNLRNQTQARIDEGFIGRDTGRLEQRDTRDKPKIIGVGRYDARKAPVSLTTTLRDFNKATATTNTSQIGSYAVPVVLVIKKNYRTLSNLIDWLKEHSAREGTEMVDQPMLLIDDEADNASINIQYGRDEISRINGQIRDLLGMFQRSCYVGYTATPFANIFIDPDTDEDVENEDLFPRHFIIGLDAPSNYFGARKVFIDGLPDEEDERPEYLRFIEDNGDLLPVKHKIDHPITELPESMKEALRAFLIARALRNARGQKGQHASMLVNASRFTGIQNTLKLRLHETLKVYENALRVNGSRSDAINASPEIAELHETWEAEYSSVSAWDEVVTNLLGVAASAQVIAVNSSSPGSLDYENSGDTGLTVIAVGGFSLSRGLTLEGLTVSYFLRNSMMYDTLMQMGRWFGYRTNYEDLCRIWMPEEAASWYAHIGEATDELLRELKRMEQHNATPEEFGLAVRSHPSALMVTARNKMGSGEKHVLVGLSNNFIETTKLGNDENVRRRNREAQSRLLEALRDTGKNEETALRVSGGYLVKDVRVDLIDSFLRDFDNVRDSILTDTRPVRQYIRDRSEAELAKWDLLVVSTGRGPEEAISIDGWNIRPVQRRVGPDALADQCILAISGKKARLASRGIEKAGLSQTQIDRAEAEFNESSQGKTKANYPDSIYRDVRERPLFILFNIRITKEGLSKDQAKLLPKEPVVGWGISFPRSKNADRKVEYILNTTKLQEMFGDPDDDEETEFEDD